MSVVGSVPPVVSVSSGGGEVSDGASPVVVVGSSVVVVVSSGVVVETPGTVVAVPSLATEPASPLTELSTPSSANVVSVVSPPESHDASNVTNSMATNVNHPQARRSRRVCLADPMSCRLLGGPIFDDADHSGCDALASAAPNAPTPFHAPREAPTARYRRTFGYFRAIARPEPKEPCVVWAGPTRPAVLYGPVLPDRLCCMGRSYQTGCVVWAGPTRPARASVGGRLGEWVNRVLEEGGDPDRSGIGLGFGEQG